MRSLRSTACAAILLAASAHAQDAVPAPPDIRAVDFCNFVYTAHMQGVRVRVRDGRWRRPLGEFELNPQSLGIDDVVYGDLTGDGRDEAVVELEECGGGTGRFTYASVYTPDARVPRRLGNIPEGDRADGGLAALRIVDGRLLVDRFGHDRGGAMDPDWIETESWSLRDERLHLDAHGDHRAYFNHPREDRVRPRPHSARAVVAGHVSPGYSDRWRLAGRAHHSWLVDLTRVTVAEMRAEMRAADGSVLGAVVAGERILVAAPVRGGTLVVTSGAPASYWIELTLIDGAPAGTNSSLGPS